ncbi:GGDEF domain-containing protein [Demequina aestuarii]|uniref:GGDEF domain-containing protein n=1 Tax=Demequina aestuarii TaxID=327095 RepID=UPI00078543BE|nr:GGDEF domain-containing protein [Demequina aestuarii]
MIGSLGRRPFRRALEIIVNSGVSGLDPVRARSVMGANRFFLMSAAVCLPWVIVIAAADPPLTLVPALMHVAMVCGWVVCVDLNRRRHYVTASVIGLTWPIAQFAFLSWMFSNESGFPLPMLTVGALAFLVFPPHEWRAGAGVTALAAGMLVVMYLLESFDEPEAAVGDRWMDLTSVGNVLLVAFILSVLALFNNQYFVRERRRNDDLLGEAQVAARTDALTEVYNRRGIAPLLSDAARSGEYALALADLDRFKRINDRLGHGAGDVVLSNVARTLVDAVGERGTVARWGGEEFLVLLPGMSLTDAVAVMERARRAMEEEYGATAFLEPVTISAGVAHARRHTSKEETLRLADAKLYEAKASGRNLVLGASVALSVLD